MPNPKLANLLVHFPLQCVLFAVFYDLAYWLIGIPAGAWAENYFYCFAILLATNAVGFAYAQLLAITAPSADWALAVFPISFLFLASFSGFTLLVTDIPVGWRWGRYVSFVRWTFQVLHASLYSGCGRIFSRHGVVGFGLYLDPLIH